MYHVWYINPPLSKKTYILLYMDEDAGVDTRVTKEP